MILILPLDGRPPKHFETFDELFESVNAAGNSKHVNQDSDFEQKDWNYKVLTSKQVADLYANSKDPPDAMKEAIEDKLPLIEICAGDYQKPLYIVLTPNVDMDYLQRKWCIDYCTYHHIVVKEY